jgi:hypothetical protein
VPLIKKSLDVVQLVLPYLIYFTIRNQVQDDFSLTDPISGYLNQILGSQSTAHLDLTLSMLEFLKIAMQ